MHFLNSWIDSLGPKKYEYKIFLNKSNILFHDASSSMREFHQKNLLFFSCLTVFRSVEEVDMVDLLSDRGQEADTKDGVS